ncbi:PKD domain-containing protein [Longitalea luteola]|uniref:PKD domain-containing protein n=1 Tax=Longitalea luteola TaxID=2812563 RepID=UPI001A968A90|nr:PKD domain-containing protein [Longitalea luteola]
MRWHKLRWLFALLCLFTGTKIASCKREQVIAAHADFSYEIVDNNFTVPVKIRLTNNSSGGNQYKWTFEGGTPATSDKRDPGEVVFNQAGSFNITLETWNADSRDEKSDRIALDSSVRIDFIPEILVNEYAPAQVRINNRTVGASAWLWTFAGGSPATVLTQHPGTISFAEPGDHVITLTVNNGRKEFTLSKTITLKQPLAPAFSIEPSFDDEDYQAPLTATLNNTTISGLTWKWETTGGTIPNPADSSPHIHFAAPGTYTVTLTADNKKETRSVSHTITVLPNSNLRTFSDVKLGVNTAHGSIGSFFSTSLRKKFKAGDDLSVAGRDIDIVFFGLNKNFLYNRFASPDSADKYVFDPIPGATNVTIINSLENSPYAAQMTPAVFDGMTTDAVLRSIPVDYSDAAWKQFDNGVVPRIVLFKKSNGIKGAIKIKQFVQDEMQSYIIVDIKVQKEP